MRDLHFWRTGKTEPDAITGTRADGRIAGAGDLLTIPHTRDQLISITQKWISQNHHAKTTPYMPRFRGSCGQVRARAAPSPPACAARADRGAEHPLDHLECRLGLAPLPVRPLRGTGPGLPCGAPPVPGIGQRGWKGGQLAERQTAPGPSTAYRVPGSSSRLSYRSRYRRPMTPKSCEPAFLRARAVILPVRAPSASRPSTIPGIWA